MSGRAAPRAPTPKSGRRRVELKLIRDRAHYLDVVMGAVANARVTVWIATANVKELRVEDPIGSRARVPIGASTRNPFTFAVAIQTLTLAFASVRIMSSS